MWIRYLPVAGAAKRPSAAAASEAYDMFQHKDDGAIVVLFRP